MLIEDCIFLLIKEFDFKIDNINERLRFQRILFLLQHSKIDFGHAFNWYKYGPYSQPLADEFFNITGREKQFEKKKIAFGEKTRARLDKFKKAIEKFHKKHHLLDLISSLSFIYSHWVDNDRPIDYRIIKKGKMKETLRIFNQKRKTYSDGKEITEAEIKFAVQKWKEFEREIFVKGEIES